MISSDKNTGDRLGAWVWLMPAAFIVHVVEEAFGGDGLMEWMAAGGGVDWSLAEFLGSNLVGAVILCVAAWASMRWTAWRWPVVSGATIFAANGVWHAAICVMTRSFVPGVLTGVILYIPLGLIVVIKSRRLMSPGAVVFAVITGMVIHGAVIWFVLRMPGFQMG